MIVARVVFLALLFHAHARLPMMEAAKQVREPAPVVAQIVQ